MYFPHYICLNKESIKWYILKDYIKGIIAEDLLQVPLQRKCIKVTLTCIIVGRVSPIMIQILERSHYVKKLICSGSIHRGGGIRLIRDPGMGNHPDGPCSEKVVCGTDGAAFTRFLDKYSRTTWHNPASSFYELSTVPVCWQPGQRLLPARPFLTKSLQDVIITGAGFTTPQGIISFLSKQCDWTLDV